jgi:hypothetical protein
VNLDFTRQLRTVYRRDCCYFMIASNRVVLAPSSIPWADAAAGTPNTKLSLHAVEQVGACTLVPGALLLRVFFPLAVHLPFTPTATRRRNWASNSGRDGVKWARPTLPRWICRRVGLMQQTHLIPVRKGGCCNK